MDMKDKVVVITGAARGIGQALAAAFHERAAQLATIDLLDNGYFTGDLANEATLEAFVGKIKADFGKVDYLINNACLNRGGLYSCTTADFNYVLQTAVTAPFVLTQRLMSCFTADAAVVNIASTRYLMSQRDTESYSAAKGALVALTHAMAVTLAGRVRVNAVSPGWIDTEGRPFHAADMRQHPVGRVGLPADIVNAVLFLCGEESSFITGQNFIVDGGMSKLMIYHDDQGWTYDGS